MKWTLLQILAFLLAFQNQIVFGSGQSVCARVHADHFSPGQRVQIREIPEVESQITFSERGFDRDAQENLLDLLSMLVETRDSRINGKLILKDNELRIGLNLSQGYKLSIKYQSEAHGTTFVAKSVILRSPSFQEVNLLSRIIEFNSLKMRSDSTVSLKDNFPDGFHFNVGLPLEIKGVLLADLQGLLARLGEFDSTEVRQLVQTRNLSKLKWLGHARAFKSWAMNVLSKKIFTKTLEYGIIFSLVSHLGGPAQVNSPGNPIIPVTIADWVLELSLALGLEIGKENLGEVLALNTLIKSELSKERKTPQLKIEKPQTKMKLLENRFVWMANSAKTHRSYLVFSRDQDAGAIEYVSVEIDPKQFPKIIGALKKSRSSIELSE